ncbi:dehydrogenase E1 [Helicosporidium sp. ATCC 50920]|nr:dehydrogenase E1 [Helicosporidium sp. ATCC 50920]|eukprot:KDD75894.1 dehydrogenase E1 [Helicosporidium sp. ATCC 50920]
MLRLVGKLPLQGRSALSLLASRGLKTSVASPCAAPAGASASASAAEFLDYPGGRVQFTPSLTVQQPAAQSESIPCYRVLDGQGVEIPGAEVAHALDKDTSIKMYHTMLTLQTVDTLFYEAQRQGRFSFYMTSTGEEATVIGAAAALSPEDIVFTQYREQGVLMWRGFTPRQMADQCYGNVNDVGKGRQMPVHYGSRDLKFHTVSSPLGTQLPHAVGAAYAARLQGKNVLTAAFFGEGAASEGDFHAALNFAATLRAPVLFLCRNNGWAISTPASEQYRGDGIAGRGRAYGIPTLRCDGGDALAVFNAVKAARERSLEMQGPVLLEAMSYRSGHHSTSDDSSRYRAADEMKAWRQRDAVTRFEGFLASKGWFDAEETAALRKSIRKEVIKALEEAAKTPKPPVSELFTDVYDKLPAHLLQQQEEVAAFLKLYPEALPPGVKLQ